MMLLSSINCLCHFGYYSEPNAIFVLGTIDGALPHDLVLGSGYVTLGLLTSILIIGWFVTPMFRVTQREMKRRPLFEAIRIGLMAGYPNRPKIMQKGESNLKPVKI